MAKNVLIQTLVSAMNIDALNRSFVHTAEVENGMIFKPGAISTTADEEEVFTIEAPATGGLLGVWMSAEPEVVMTKAGDKKYYKGLNPDVRDFAIDANQVFSGFKPVVGDLITLTGGAVLLGTYTAGVSAYVNATDGSMGLTWADVQTADAFSMKLVRETYISITDGSQIGANQRVPAFTFEVVAN